VILFILSFSTINNSILPIGAVAAEVENNEDEETAYIKFASQTVKQSDNSCTVSATIQLRGVAKGPPIPAKGYLVQQIRWHNGKNQILINALVQWFALLILQPITLKTSISD
jgi:hypothetical protein